jgi:hypothetical protein
LSFQGPIVLGKGFILDPATVQALLNQDPRNCEVLFPYLNGEDLNSSPTQAPSRYVINFFDWSLAKAAEYPACLAVVRNEVKPVRERDKRKAYRDRWWQFAEKRRAMYEAIEGLTRVVAIALTSKAVMPLFVPTGSVFAHSLGIFAFDDYAHLGLLSSAFHSCWAIARASTLETRIRYTPSDCFETFPSPSLTQAVATSAEQLDTHRRKMMVDRNEGLTKLYNRINDPAESDSDSKTLRHLHVLLDYAIAEAYGWADILLDHDFYGTPQGVRYTVGPSVRVELLDRLLELNHERHRREGGEGTRG